MRYLPLTTDPEVLDEAVRVADDFERQTPGTGKKFISQFANTLQRIEDNPRMYAIVRGRKRLADLHRFPFAVIYTIHRTEVHVSALIPTRSNPLNWFRRGS